MGKLKKLKISKIKRNYQIKTKLSKQGKLKTRRHKPPKKQFQKPAPPCPEVVEEEESDHGEDLMNMVEEDDLKFLEKAISNRSYNLLKQIRLTESDKNQSKRKKRKTEDDHALEELYENNVSKIMEETSKKSVRMMLPIKTQNGLVEKRVIEEDNEVVNEEEDQITDNNQKENEENNQENSDIEMDIDTCNNLQETDKPVSTVELLACREELLKSKRFKIGILSSGILENPQLKSGNFKILLDMMDERASEVYITVRKLAMVSLLEVFKDLLPSYSLLQVSQEGIKLKKETLALQNYEATLLSSYKNYLKRLEKISKILRKKKGDTRSVNEREMRLGEIALSCMCELLTTHPYFNFSVNIANYILPFLDNKQRNIRERVAQCISQIFKDDKRGQLSLTIVRKLNQYIKSRKHSVHPEVITVLLSLRIKDVNLDKEKEEETKQRKLMSHKQRILALSRRERKKNKKLEQVEKELLETKAEENKQTKSKILTEITSVIFTIYFRVLKQAPNSKVLSVCLEGLAKFAHCINIDFYQDLVSVIDKLIEEDHLGLRQQLHCIQCIFTILSGQGAALNIDPYRFYVHLYKNILKVHCGRTHAETEIVLKTLTQILIHQRKRISQTRLIAFVKKISIQALQLQHNATLATLGIIKQVMQFGKAAHILLDTDCSGDSHYQIEIEEPDYCNAHSTALYELVALQRHYHSIVRQLAKNIAHVVPTSGEGSLPVEIAKLTPEELYIEYDPSGVAFKPTIPIPEKITVKKASIHHVMSSKLEEYLNTVDIDNLFTDRSVDFYKACKNNSK
ncbi:Nucleolar complex protein 3-like protein [Camponotus floridanus]|uniref:Nucleolar complex protein 3 homolog n=1 Tax=Camponotus floridanus TaxID=104421 RepID=E2AC18_CAMFO|nr:nucleolar complex protein 3 homolog [Camponotus floridanus]EFN69036.1 Nucleolar complex protein 3-like protein [Camponotus floridanus]